MTSVEVEYCDPCGFIDRATEMQTQILESCGETVAGVELVPVEDGIFEVRVDDTVVFDVRSYVELRKDPIVTLSQSQSGPEPILFSSLMRILAGGQTHNDHSHYVPPIAGNGGGDGQYGTRVLIIRTSPERATFWLPAGRSLATGMKPTNGIRLPTTV